VFRLYRSGDPNSFEGKSQAGEGIGWFRAMNELHQKDVVTLAAVSGGYLGRRL
jgi:hypothetical protein